MKIKDMETSHLINTLTMLRRKQWHPDHPSVLGIGAELVRRMARG